MKRNKKWIEKVPYPHGYRWAQRQCIEIKASALFYHPKCRSIFWGIWKSPQADPSLTLRCLFNPHFLVKTEFERPQKIIQEMKVEVAHFKIPFIQKRGKLMTSNTNQNISHTTLAIRFIKILKCSNDNHILTIELL